MLKYAFYVNGEPHVWRVRGTNPARSLERLEAHVFEVFGDYPVTALCQIDGLEADATLEYKVTCNARAVARVYEH